MNCHFCEGVLLGAGVVFSTAVVGVLFDSSAPGMTNRRPRKTTTAIAAMPVQMPQLLDTIRLRCSLLSGGVGCGGPSRTGNVASSCENLFP